MFTRSSFLRKQLSSGGLLTKDAKQSFRFQATDMKHTGVQSVVDLQHDLPMEEDSEDKEIWVLSPEELSNIPKRLSSSNVLGHGNQIQEIEH